MLFWWFGWGKGFILVWVGKLGGGGLFVRVGVIFGGVIVWNIWGW